MHQPHRRALVVCLAIVVVALCFSLAVAPSLSLRGVPGPTFRIAESPFLAAIWTLIALALATVVACGVGRLLNAVVGLFVLGCGVGFLAMRSGTIVDVVFGGPGVGASGGGGSGSPARIIDLAIESFAWAGLVLATAAVVFRVSGPLPDQIPGEDPRVDGPFGTRGLLSQCAGAIVLLAVWALVVTPTKGQALGAVVVGSMLVGLVGRLIAPRTPPILLFAAPILFGAIGQIVAHVMVTKGSSLDAVYVGRELSRLAFPMPIDYAAGSLVGVALGIGWSRSFLKTEAVVA